MIDWRDVRSDKDLKKWLKHFATLAQDAQRAIREEMCDFLEEYKGFVEIAADSGNFYAKTLTKQPAIGSPGSTKRPRRKRRAK